MARKSTATTDMDNKVRCPRCGSMNSLTNSDLYVSRSELFSYYGKLIYCKKCIGEIYDKLFEKYEDEKTAIYYMCRKLDMPFSHGNYEGAAKEAHNKGWQIYQTYIQKMNSLGGLNNCGNSFDDSDIFLESKNKKIDLNIEINKDVKLFWGYGFDDYDYLFLESELAKWKSTHKCDNQAEVTLLREICIKVLDIRKKRELNEDTSKHIKDLQDLMKTASVDPAKANSIGSGQAVDRFGVWLKDIEEKKPAEWWEEQEKYKDMDGFIPYIKNYIVRPIKNFFTGVKDFTIDGENLSFEDKEDGEK